MYYLIIPALISLVSCQKVELHMNCSDNHLPCEIAEKVTIFNETLTLQSDQNCGDCSLFAKIATDYAMNLTWTASTWGPFDYFYINQTNGFLAFTGSDNTCQFFVDQNELQAHFYFNGSIHIKAFQRTPCQTTENCMLSNDCNNLHWVHQIYVVRYEELSKSDIFLADVIPRRYWPTLREAKGQLPQCIPDCKCTLHFQRLLAHCAGGTSTEAILIHQKTTFPSDVALTLDAANSGIMTIAEGAFQGLEHISRLDLSDNPLSTVTSHMFQGLQVISLDALTNPSKLYKAIQLQNCNLTDLPPDIFTHLILLNFIDVSENQLAMLHPDTFSHQLFLVALILRSNLLSTLPVNILRASKNLLWLDLGGNHFTELNPDVIKPVPKLKLLMLDHNELRTLRSGTFKALERLDWLYLQENNLEEVPPEAFEGTYDLDRLDLSGNRFSTLKPRQFEHLTTLIELVLNRNNLKAIPKDVFDNNKQLRILELENNKFQSFDLQIIDKLDKLSILSLANNNLVSLTLKKESTGFPLRVNDTNKEVKLWPKLRLVLLENNSIDSIEDSIWEEMPLVKLLILRNNPLKEIGMNTFRALDNKTRVFVSEAATCCFISKAICTSQNPKAPYLTCQRLLPNVPLQVFMWTIGIFAILGNLFVMAWHCIKHKTRHRKNHGQKNDVQVLLIQNLAASDLLMGVYMLIVACADAFYGHFFPSYADSWRSGPLCKLAGVLSIVSSEASVFFVTLISIDRFMAIWSSFGQWQVSKKAATGTLVLLWIFALLLSIIPTLFSGVEPDFYDVSEVCIGLPFVRSLKFVNTTNIIYEYDLDQTSLDTSSAREAIYNEAYHSFESSQSPGLFYSIALFLGLNLACFIIVALCYLGIFIIYKHSKRQVGMSNLNQQLNLAIRMGLIVLTDFACWMPIVVLGILVQSSALTISPVVYVYIVVFVLPINSAVNPFLYSVAFIIADYRRKKKQRQAEDQMQRKRQGDGQKMTNRNP